MTRKTIHALSIIILSIATVFMGEEACAQTMIDAKGCSIEIAVQQVEAFVTSQIGKISGQTMPLLDEMAALSSKASKPGVAIGRGATEI